MKLWKKIAGAIKHPFEKLSNEVQEEMAETATFTTQAVLGHIGNALPEIGDLLSGDEVTLDVQIKLRLRQKGEE